MSPESRFQRHPRRTLIGLLLFTGAIAPLLSELVARALLPGWAPAREERVKFWKYDKLLGWTHRPNQRGRFNHRDFSVEVAINSQGLRDIEYPMKRTEKRRMLVLGDSFGWGFGVERTQCFSEVLEDSHPDWEIINASVSGYGTDQEFLYLRDRSLAFKPDVVLLLFCDNDFQDNVRSEHYWHWKPQFVMNAGNLDLRNVPVPKATLKQRVARVLLGRTYLGPTLYYGGRNLYHRMLKRHRPMGTGGSLKVPRDERREDGVTPHLIQALNELCRRNHSTLIIVSVPMSVVDRTFLQEIATQEGIPYLPLDDYFASTPTVKTLPHDMHWNAEGHKAAAEAIDLFLRKLGIFVQ